MLLNCYIIKKFNNFLNKRIYQYFKLFISHFFSFFYKLQAVNKLILYISSNFSNFNDSFNKLCNYNNENEEFPEYKKWILRKIKVKNEKNEEFVIIDTKNTKNIFFFLFCICLSIIFLFLILWVVIFYFRFIKKYRNFLNTTKFFVY